MGTAFGNQKEKQKMLVRAVAADWREPAGKGRPAPARFGPRAALGAPLACLPLLSGVWSLLEAS